MAYGRSHGRPAGNPGEDAFFPSEVAGVLNGLFVRHLFDDIDQREVEHLRHEAGADAPDLVRTRLERFAGERLREDRAGGGLDRDREDRFAAGILDVTRNAGDGATGPDPGNENIDIAVGVVPDLGSGGALVDRRVGRVLELLQQHVAIRVRLGDLLGPGDGTSHAFGALGQDQTGAIGDQQLAPLLENCRKILQLKSGGSCANLQEKRPLALTP